MKDWEMICIKVGGKISCLTLTDILLTFAGLSWLRKGRICFSSQILNTGRHITLCHTSCWHQNKSCVLVHGPHTKTVLLFWCQWEVLHNLIGHPVLLIANKKSPFQMGETFPNEGYRCIKWEMAQMGLPITRATGMGLQNCEMRLSSAELGHWDAKSVVHRQIPFAFRIYLSGSGKIALF